MNKPQRLVMSMAPNKSYLEGYNAALDATEAYRNEATQLLTQLLNLKGMPPKEVSLYQPLCEFMRDEITHIMAKHIDCATEYDVDMDRQREQDCDREGLRESDDD